MSYSRETDADTARQLQRLIRRVGRRWYRPSLMRVYRDQTNTPISDNLPEVLQKAIDESGFFLLLASPASARSKWVQFEVEHWIATNRSTAEFGIVLTDGVIAWGGGDFDWLRTDALPGNSMRGWYGQEPTWAHLTPFVGRRGQRDEQLRDAARAVVSRLSNVDKDTIDSEDQRETRRAQRTLRGLLVGLAILLVLALVAAGTAFTELTIATQRERGVTAQLLLSQARATISASPRTALQMAEAAYHLDPTPEADDTIVELLNSTRYSGFLTGPTDFVHAVAYSPDGQILAVASFDKTVTLWDVRDPARPRRLGPPLTAQSESVLTVAFAPGGQTMATGGFDNTVVLWDVRDPTRPQRLGAPLTGHASAVNAVAFSPDGKTLATGGQDKSVLLWDLRDPRRPQRLGMPLAGHADAVSSVAFSPDGRTLATGGGSAVILWDVRDPLRPQRLSSPPTGSTGSATPLAFSPTGQSLATGSGTGENAMIVWDVRDPTRPRRLGSPLTGHTDAIASAAFSPDGHTLATGSDDHTVILWDLRDPTRALRLPSPLVGQGDFVSSAAFSPDGHTLAVSGGRPLSTGIGSNTVVLWDVQEPTRPQRLGSPLSGHTGFVSSVAFSPDGRTLATGSEDATVILWDVHDPRPTAAHRPTPHGQPGLGERGGVLPGRDTRGRGRRRQDGDPLGPTRTRPAATRRLADRTHRVRELRGVCPRRTYARQRRPRP